MIPLEIMLQREKSVTSVRVALEFSQGRLYFVPHSLVSAKLPFTYSNSVNLLLLAAFAILTDVTSNSDGTDAEPLTFAIAASTYDSKAIFSESLSVNSK